MARLGELLPRVIAVGLVLLALSVLERELAEYGWADLKAAFAALPEAALWWSGLAAAASFACLATHDPLALRWLGKPAPLGRALAASSIGYSLSHALGFAPLTGGAARWRLYRGQGWTSGDIAALMAANAVAMTLGIGASFALAGLLATAEIAQLTGLPAGLVSVLAGLVGLVTIGYVWLACEPRWWPAKRLAPAPGPAITLAQLATSLLDWTLAAFALWILLPSAEAPSLLAFLAIFTVAGVAAMLGQVPAGLGVLEAAALFAMPAAPPPTVLSAVLAYRLIYQLLPLALGTCGFVLLSWRGGKRGTLVLRLAKITLGGAGRSVVGGMRRLLPVRQPAVDRLLAGPSAVLAAEAILAGGTELPAASALALLGDKQLLLSPSGRSGLMLGRQGRQLLALGMPIGDPAETGALLWQFRALCASTGAMPAFYGVGPAALGGLSELGLRFLKIGEQAVVPLAAFSLDGGLRAGIRQVRRRGQRDGRSFELCPPAAVPALWPELAAISDAWLARKSAAEKGFSLGRFDLAFVRRFPLGLLRHDGRIVAFASLWSDPGRTEVAVDLMRYLPSAPKEAMEHLLIELMLWAKAEGYARFDLGMAPLAGLSERADAPLLTGLAAALARHGEPFYGFAGLYRFKQKFHPDWQPRYLAAPGQIGLARAAIAATLLIGGGWRALYRPRAAGQPDPASHPAAPAAAGAASV